MKMICVGRNYIEHARELGSEIPEEPVLFLKPDTAMLPPGEPFRLPPFSKEIHHEIELVLRISKKATQVSVEDSAYCYDQIGLGLDFTARDLQSKCKAKGLPWEIAKAFDGSAAVGEFGPVPSGDIEFDLRRGGQVVQAGSSRQMLHRFDALISFASRYFTLLPGDLVFTGTPAGVGPVASGDLLEGYLNGQLRLTCSVK
ncbi:fumarylacetoacetate hydrolase family protein [Fimbriimonas ginsengisoli]|nr:fumarylacetoacetate hydrolase family protein [Fimbriimonas ginsengisoli]